MKKDCSKAEQTMADKFFELFPNAPRYTPRYGTDDIPRACPYKLGWCDIDDCRRISCNTCWSRPYKEVN